MRARTGQGIGVGSCECRIEEFWTAGTVSPGRAPPHSVLHAVIRARPNIRTAIQALRAGATVVSDFPKGLILLATRPGSIMAAAGVCLAKFPSATARTTDEPGASISRSMPGDSR
jgi:hypothetical protein